MAQVIARPNENFESLIHRFKKASERDGLLADVRKHEFFEKPSVRRKRKEAAARKRCMKNKKRTERFTPKSNQNFKFNKDKTKKIPTLPPKKNFVFKKKPYNNNRPKLQPFNSKGN
ncbi:MAG: 30S ribosomal protein S21 [Patescibacteria group bacterium]